ncbi:MAG: CoA transferase [Burkholderiaceae bacterium]|nr:CoA transferase [Burkholderiaceae bacterium]
MLDGLLVLDFSRILAGPYCTAMLGDLGARVIKVEPPQGDDQRRMGVIIDGESASFAMINRNKQGIRLDLGRPEGQRIARQLAARADVVVENFRPGVADKLGIGYQRLSADNERLVYCSVSGFGQRGPLATTPAYDIVAQALSGLMSITGDPEGPPTLVGESVGDICAGMFAAWGILSALYARERTGRGRHVDVAMFDSLFAILPTALTRYLYAGVEPKRVGNRHPLSAPFGAYAARDGHFVLAAANDKLFGALAEVIGQPQLATDPRFATDSARSSNDAELRALIEGWSRGVELAQVVAAFGAAGVPCAPIQGIAAAASSTQVRDRDLLLPTRHPAFGDCWLAPQPVKFSSAASNFAAAAPGLGEHTDTVLAELLGLDAAELADLHGKAVV